MSDSQLGCALLTIRTERTQAHSLDNNYCNYNASQRGVAIFLVHVDVSCYADKPEGKLCMCSRLAK